MGGISGEIASIVLFFNPIPLLPSPCAKPTRRGVKGEERSYPAFMRLPWTYVFAQTRPPKHCRADTWASPYIGSPPLPPTYLLQFSNSFVNLSLQLRQQTCPQLGALPLFAPASH